MQKLYELVWSTSRLH